MNSKEVGCVRRLHVSKKGTSIWDRANVNGLVNFNSENDSHFLLLPSNSRDIIAYQS